MEKASAPILPADRLDVKERGEEHVIRDGTKLDRALRAFPAVDPTGQAIPRRGRFDRRLHR